ncbi:hypothetical protein NP233_g1434 [Leucocoprinus birnbaumii]|uniref:Uncharacterized protein n=1 Tax=Leucocoprinus birnbaumii TaxID=56174 RepID=A0AAD5W5L1_9AGAR|nr:hypothetical protein NP233_g1434 [Leucocoprinus birnbaumii]
MVGIHTASISPALISCPSSWQQFLCYPPSRGIRLLVSMANAQNITFEDNIPSFVYNPRQAWISNRGYGTPGQSNSGTYSSSEFMSSPYANVTFHFPIPGSAFYYYGLRRSGVQGRFGICADCNPPKDPFKVVNLSDIPIDPSNPSVLLYSQRWNQKPSIHTVKIWNMPDPQAGGSGSQITVDRIVVESPAASAMGSSGKGRTGAIVGGVVGGIVFLILLAIASWLLWRRTRRKKGARAVLDDEEGETMRNADNDRATSTVTPFRIPSRREVDAGPAMGPPSYDDITANERSEWGSSGGDGATTLGTTQATYRGVSPSATGKRNLRVEN